MRFLDWVVSMLAPRVQERLDVVCWRCHAAPPRRGDRLCEECRREVWRLMSDDEGLTESRPLQRHVRRRPEARPVPRCRWCSAVLRGRELVPDMCSACFDRSQCCSRCGELFDPVVQGSSICPSCYSDIRSNVVHAASIFSFDHCVRTCGQELGVIGAASGYWLPCEGCSQHTMQMYRIRQGTAADAYQYELERARREEELEEILRAFDLPDDPSDNILFEPFSLADLGLTAEEIEALEAETHPPATGATQVLKISCPGCGERGLDPMSEFCIHCGRKLR